MLKIYPVIVAAALLSAAATAQAQSSNGIWSLDGYGTVGVAHSSDEMADYVPNFILSEGPGRSHQWDSRLDSRLAVQISAQPSSRLSAVVQVIAEQHYDKSFKPLVEWANVQYQLSPEFSIRAGRTAIGTFMVSDHRKVGYSLPWVRPPADLYHLLPLTNSDGVGVLYQHESDNFRYSAELHYGRTKAEELDGLLEAPTLWNFTNHLQRGPLTLHLSYMRTKAEYGEFLDTIWDAYRAFGPAGEAVVQRYDPNGHWSSFSAIGASYEPGDWFLMAEWGRGNIGSDFGSRDGRYISGGYRFGAITPFITYALVDSHYDHVNGLDASNFPDLLAPTIAQLNAGLAITQDGFGAKQQTWSAGARWDLLPTVSAKLQYDHARTQNGSSGTFRNNPVGYQPRGANIISVTLDFVF